MKAALRGRAHVVIWFAVAVLVFLLGVGISGHFAFNRLWLGVALFVSFFWGFRSTILYTRDPVEEPPEEKQGPYVWRAWQPTLSVFLVAAYQFIFNFVGSVLGWLALYLLLKRTAYLTRCENLASADFVLSVFALLGLTGHLPEALYGVVVSIGKLAEKATDKLTS